MKINDHGYSFVTVHNEFGDTAQVNGRFARFPNTGADPSEPAFRAGLLRPRLEYRAPGDDHAASRDATAAGRIAARTAA
jgi:hypothetical protein